MSIKTELQEHLNVARNALGRDAGNDDEASIFISFALAKRILTELNLLASQRDALLEYAKLEQEWADRCSILAFMQKYCVKRPEDITDFLAARRTAALAKAGQ